MGEYRRAEEYGASNSSADCGAKYACAFSIFEQVDSVESLLDESTGNQW